MKDGTSFLFDRLAAELLGDGYRVRFRPRGVSMFPTIRSGDPLTVEPVRADEVKRGDVVLYRSDRGMIVHRVERILDRGEGDLTFLLRGDAAQALDRPVGAGRLLGRVAVREHGGRSLDLCRGPSRLFYIARLRAARFKRWLATRLGAGPRGRGAREA